MTTKTLTFEVTDNPYSDVNALLIEALNRIGDRDDDHDDSELKRLAAELEKAIETAQALASDADDRSTFDHEAWAEDMYWDAKLSEHLGK